MFQLNFNKKNNKVHKFFTKEIGSRTLDETHLRYTHAHAILNEKFNNY